LSVFSEVLLIGSIELGNICKHFVRVKIIEYLVHWRDWERYKLEFVLCELVEAGLL